MSRTADLISAAKKARLNARAAHSGFKVGAAIETRKGRIFGGCNVENAAYPMAICAERTALVKAVSEGQREFTAIAVATRNGGSPCGACRQVMREFAPHLRVLLTDDAGHIRQFTLDQLLPESFGPESLK